MKRLLILVLPLGMVLGMECPRQQADLGPAKLKAFASADELKQYMAEQYNAYSYGGAMGLPGGVFGCAPTDLQSRGGNGAPTADAPAEGAPLGGDFSTTNLQEAGVDESDVIKSDGTNLYVLSGQKLSVVQAVPADQMRVAGSLTLDLPGKEMYLMAGGQAVVLAAPSWYYGGYGGWAEPAVAADDQSGQSEQPWLTDRDTFDVYLVDMSDPAAMQVTRKYSFEGTLVTSRMIDTKLYLVGVTYPNAQPLTGNRGPDIPVDDLLPRYRAGEGQDETVAPLVGYENVYHPVNPDGWTLVTVTTLDVANPDTPPAATGVMADYGVIYASPESLYLTSTNYYYGYERESTEVHKFDLTGDSATYAASGTVPGWLLNQFSMGEKDGFLRVASTEGYAGMSWGWASTSSAGSAFSATVPASENHVVVLEQVDDRLEIAGRIDGIALGEQLYAARFVGDRGFLVTFKNTDPLFTVDLSDPRNPVLVGELKVPGFSEYIHMLDENHLLTIGKDAQEVEQEDFAWYLGLKLSIFDVTDFAAPKELHTETIGVRGTDSEALRNHKAFTYHNGMLAFPIHLYEGNATPPAWGYYTFGGLMVYRVSAETGFAYAGRIATINQSSPWSWGSNEWTRGAFVGQTVYAVSPLAVKAAAVDGMSTLVGAVDLP